MHLREPQTLLPRSWFLRACAIPVSYHQLWKPGANLVKTGEELERRPYCTPELLWGLEELWLRKERAQQDSSLVLLLPGHATIVSSRPVGDPMPSQGCEPFPFEHTATAGPSALCLAKQPRARQPCLRQLRGCCCPCLWEGSAPLNPQSPPLPWGRAANLLFSGPSKHSQLLCLHLTSTRETSDKITEPPRSNY